MFLVRLAPIIQNLMPNARYTFFYSTYAFDPRFNILVPFLRYSGSFISYQFVAIQALGEVIQQ